MHTKGVDKTYTFIRVGPVSGQRQKYADPPARKGIWMTPILYASDGELGYLSAHKWSLDYTPKLRHRLVGHLVAKLDEFEAQKPYSYDVRVEVVKCYDEIDAIEKQHARENMRRLRNTVCLSARANIWTHFAPKGLIHSSNWFQMSAREYWKCLLAYRERNRGCSAETDVEVFWQTT